MAALIYMDTVTAPRGKYKQVCLHSCIINPYEPETIRNSYVQKTIRTDNDIDVTAMTLKELYHAIRNLELPEGARIIAFVDDEDIVNHDIPAESMETWRKIQALCRVNQYQVTYTYRGLLYEAVHEDTLRFAVGR